MRSCAHALEGLGPESFKGSAQLSGNISHAGTCDSLGFGLRPSQTTTERPHSEALQSTMEDVYAGNG